MKEWVFYSIYVPRAEYLENIIVNIVTPVVKQVKDSVQVHKWFFIRYIDMQGSHIRLRFLVNEDDIDIVEEITEEHLNGSLSKVLAEPLSEMSRLLPVKTDTRNFESGFQQEEYEPEYEKYGGIQGVNIAEDIFQSSSELVLTLLNDPVFKDSDRFDFALFLMKKTAEQASLSADQTQDLWESMLHYWSGADYTDGITYKTKLKEAAEKRIDVINVVLEKMYSNPFAIKSTNGYQKQLKSAFSQIQESDQIRISASHLSFHYIHMMNNRLGVWPIEEAYLGALLAQISKNTTDIK